jgi:hypothetical protein
MPQGMIKKPTGLSSFNSRFPLQPLNDIAIIIPLDPSLLELQKADRFGLNVREKTLEEYLRWRVIAAGPGVYSLHRPVDRLIPEPPVRNYSCFHGSTPGA